MAIPQTSQSGNGPLGLRGRLVPIPARQPPSTFFFWMCHDASLHSVQLAPLNIFAAFYGCGLIQSSQLQAMVPFSPAFFAPNVPMCCRSVCHP